MPIKHGLYKPGMDNATQYAKCLLETMKFYLDPLFLY